MSNPIYHRRGTLHLAIPRARTMDPDVMETTVVISNLHCASCVQSIETALSALSPIPMSIDVSIVSQSATVRHGPGLSPSLIKSTIEEAGFDIAATPADVGEHVSFSESVSDLFVGKRNKHVAQCSLCQVEEGKVAGQSGEQHTAITPQSVHSLEHGPFAVSLSIGGMTCAACSNTVTRLVSEIDGVSSVIVDLIGHSGKVVIEDKKILETVVETIEDAGYDPEVVAVEHLSAQREDDSVGPRTISFKVDGMFCEHCPTKVMKALSELNDQITILKPLTSSSDPIVELSYSPSPPFFTIRTIISVISKSQDPPFAVSIYQPPSLEDRVKKMQYAERRQLLQRLAFSFVVAIPTFIIGIVYMSLVPSTNRTRKYLTEPMWNGMASRMEWAMFFLATPVMFYSAGPFHRRSVKEIRALWRKGSKTPVWQRFVRFGSMNLLVSCGVSVAYFSSIALLALAASQKISSENGDTSTYFDSVIFLTMFLLSGRFLEAYSKSRTADAVSGLGKLRPSQALLLTSSPPSNDKSEDKFVVGDVEKGDLDAEDIPTKPGVMVETIDAKFLEVGDVVRVRNGATPPADGTIVLGDTFFNESSLTGESRPVKKIPGDPVFLGTINQGRVVDVRVDVVGGQTMLDRVVDVVREGQTHRAPIERVADLITGYFVPVVTLLSTLTWIVWLSLGLSGALPESYLDIPAGGWIVWSLQFSVAVFVVACPCGIGLAAPTALLVGSGLAAKFGILVRGGGEAFQECAQLDIVVFDKTGTLTEGGQPRVTDVDPLEDTWKLEELLELAHTIESASSHPVADAIKAYCDSHGGGSVTLSDVEEIPGRGLKATVSDSSRKIIIGNVAWMEDHRVTLRGDVLQRLESWQEQGKSVVVMAIGEVEAFVPAISFAIADSLRPEAKAVISHLQNQGLGTWMLSGDNPITAKAVARQVGIPETNVIAGVLPHEKAQKIQWLQQVGMKKPLSTWRRILGLRRLNERCIVAMTGDGINDAAALTTADVGIAVGSGSDIAISSASFIILSSNLRTILTLTDLSRTVFNRVKANFFWAGIYNIIAVPIAAGVIYPIGNARLSPVWASLAMALSSVSVVCSSLMLRLYKEPKV